MAEHRKKATNSRKKLDRKKLITILVVVVVIVAAAALLDHAVRHPKCEDETDALNWLLQNVVLAMPEIGEDDGFSLEALEPETIDGKLYYPVQIYRKPYLGKDETTGEEKRGPDEKVMIIYVKASNSSTYTRNEITGGLIPYGV